MNNSIQMAQIELTEDEINAAVDVLRSGALRQGKICDEFEKRFAEKVGARYALTCSSGTAALHLAYLACLEPGDEVLVPGFTFIATASMVTMMGGKPVFCDVHPETWVIDTEDAEKRITERTRAIAPVHIFGNACPVDAVNDLAQEFELKVIWDAAQAHGTTYKGKDIGGLNDLVCYSFYPTKNMYIGEGGMVTTNNPEFAHKINYLRSHGQTGKYYHTMLGLNYRMTDVEAAIGRRQLNRLDEMLSIRRRNGNLLQRGMKDIEGITPQRITSGGEHSYHQFCILVDKETFGMDRDDLASKLSKRGIATGVHYPRGLHQQPVFEDIYGPSHLPVTEKICEQILAVPVHHGLSKESCQQITNIVHEIGGLTFQ